MNDQIAAYQALLEWAIDYVSHSIAVMRRSYADINGNFQDEDAALEIQDAERWLAQAREVLK